MSNRASTCSDSSESSENVYCILLHIVEGVGLFQRDVIGDFTKQPSYSPIILNASLNGAKFEVEGHSTETTTIFNSNCIWECDIGDVKRMKTDNRPVKIVVYMKAGRAENAPRKTIGSVLLPIRGAMLINHMRNVQLRQHWHKLSALHSEWRKYKPEIFLCLVVVKKTLVAQFEALLERKKGGKNDVAALCPSETALMLQSQSNVYVQLLEQVGLIQVGNNPDIDCDIFNVSLIFKQLKNLLKLYQLEHMNADNNSNVCVFHYDFLGSVSQLEIYVNALDCYAINEKISLSFKSSIKSLRTYFQRIFYIPITLYINGAAVASYHFNFSMHLPDCAYFNSNKLWTKNGTFYFDRFYRILSPRISKPSVDFIFNVQLVTTNSKRINVNPSGMINDMFPQYRIDDKAAGDINDATFCNWDVPQVVQLHKCTPYENCMLSHNFNNGIEIIEKNYIKVNSEQLMVRHLAEDLDETYIKSAEDTGRQTEVIRNTFSGRYSIPAATNNVCIGTDELRVLDKKVPNVENMISVGVNTEPQVESVPLMSARADQEELTLKVVQELEDWKSQQMDIFLSELERKESEYLREMRKHWEQQRGVLRAKLEVKIAKCEELNAKLEKAHAEIANNAIKHKDIVQVVEKAKQDIEKCYEQKFEMLDLQMQRLKMSLHQQGNVLELEKKDMQIENTKLEVEKNELKERIKVLEMQLTTIEQKQLSADQFSELLQALHKQSDHVAAIEKTKRYYKDEWAKAMREINRLRLCLLKEQEKSLYENNNSSFEICLEDILLEEPNEDPEMGQEQEQELELDTLITERSELNSFNEYIFENSEASFVSESEEIKTPT